MMITAITVHNLLHLKIRRWKQVDIPVQVFYEVVQQYCSGNTGLFGIQMTQAHNKMGGDFFLTEIFKCFAAGKHTPLPQICFLNLTEYLNKFRVEWLIKISLFS